MYNQDICDDPLNWCPICGDPRIICDSLGGHNLDDELWDDDEPFCDVCGCSEFHPCPGGCAWSEYFARRGRAVCTNCEAAAVSLSVNLGALQLWRAGKVQEVRG